MEAKFLHKHAELSFFISVYLNFPHPKSPSFLLQSIWFNSPSIICINKSPSKQKQVMKVHISHLCIYALKRLQERMSLDIFRHVVLTCCYSRENRRGISRIAQLFQPSGDSPIIFGLKCFFQQPKNACILSK